MARHRSRYDRDDDRARGYDRPWTGGYRQGFQGGTEGVPVGGGRRWGTERPDAGEGRRERGQDLWWLGYHGYDRQYRPTRYDEMYRQFHETAHPRFSPIGGMHSAMSGSYVRRGPPRPLAYDRWFSDWTRWF